MKEREYEVVTSPFHVDFIQTVNAYLSNDEGWQLVGGVSVTVDNQQRTIYAQALVRTI